MQTSKYQSGMQLGCPMTSHMAPAQAVFGEVLSLQPFLPLLKQPAHPACTSDEVRSLAHPVADGIS